MTKWPMMALGPFIFYLKTAPLQSIDRNQTVRWGVNNRVGRRPAYQFLGPGDEPLTLHGELRPEITGGRLSLALIRTMADTGYAWILLGGDGYYYGLWVIESIQDTQSELMHDSAPRKVEFAITLKKVDDDRTDLLGSLLGGLLGLLWA